MIESSVRVLVFELLFGDGAVGRGVVPSRGVDDLLGVVGEGGKPLVVVDVVDGGGVGGVGRGGVGGGGDGAKFGPWVASGAEGSCGGLAVRRGRSGSGSVADMVRRVWRAAGFDRDEVGGGVGIRRGLGGASQIQTIRVALEVGKGQRGGCGCGGGRRPCCSIPSFLFV